MRRLVVSLAALAPAAALPGQDAPFTWLSDFGAARARAAQEHKPLLVLFRCER